MDEETLLPVIIQEFLAIKEEVIGAKVEALSRLEIVREAGRIYVAASSKPRTRVRCCSFCDRSREQLEPRNSVPTVFPRLI